MSQVVGQEQYIKAAIKSFYFSIFLLEFIFKNYYCDLLEIIFIGVIIRYY